MKVCVTGDAKSDLEELQEAFNHYNLDVTHVNSPDISDIEKLALKWAEDKDFVAKKWPIKWSDTTVEGAVIRQNKFGDYNCRAGFFMARDIVEDSDVVLVMEPTHRNSDSIVDEADKQDKKVVYWPLDDDAPF